MAASSSQTQTARAGAGAGGRGRWGSPERNMVWTEPNKAAAAAAPGGPPSKNYKQQQRRKKVAVVYYLCNRDGHLEHPHFMEMEVSSSEMHLRDFTARLNVLRGNGMADAYSWSAKRSYRNGFVWHDLAHDDLVHPAHPPNEYVLKGTHRLLHGPRHEKDDATTSTSTRPCRHGHKNWSSFDLGDYKLQEVAHPLRATATELAIDEISPPPSSSSPDTVETLVSNNSRMRASSMLMQLISCGSSSITVKGATAARRRSSNLVSFHATTSSNNKDKDECFSPAGGGMAMDRDYFSGSLIETNKTTGRSDSSSIGALKRSASYNADRGAVKMELGANSNSKEVDGVRAMCIPRKPKSTATARREANVSSMSNDGGASS